MQKDASRNILYKYFCWHNFLFSLIVYQIRMQAVFAEMVRNRLSILYLNGIFFGAVEYIKLTPDIIYDNYNHCQASLYSHIIVFQQVYKKK